MSGPTPNQDIFDVRRVRRLVELMKEHDLSEIDIREGDTRIQLRRGADPVVSVAAPQPAAVPVAAPPAAEVFQVVKRPRIGVDYAKHWAKRLLRYYIKGNPFVSRV